MTAKPVVAATDGSAGSLRAIEWAVREAVLRSAPLRIVSAASLPKMVMLPLQPERDAALGFVRAHRDRALAAAAARAAELAPGLRVDTDPVEGQAARAVTGSGSDALMLVVGFRGIGAFAATVLGSVARYAADHASCPVAVVRDESVAARRLTLLMDTWRQKYPDVPVRHDVVHGHPGRALAGLSARADLMVIGRHATHSGPQCPGSVRHAVLNHAHGPVAIVPSS